jgi:hypothetical protein
VRTRPVLAVLVVVLGLLAPGAPVAADTSSDEAWFVSQINQLRASRGLNPLVADAELTGQARRWAQVMADDDQLKHASDLSVGINTGWDVLGENVGVHNLSSAGNLQELFQAFVSSPSHLQNLVDPRFEHVGVGVVHDTSGRIWTAHRFMSVTGTAPPTAAPAPTTPPTAAPTPPPAPTAAPPAPATSAPLRAAPAPAPAPPGRPVTSPTTSPGQPSTTSPRPVRSPTTSRSQAPADRARAGTPDGHAPVTQLDHDLIALFLDELAEAGI